MIGDGKMAKNLWTEEGGRRRREIGAVRDGEESETEDGVLVVYIR